MKGKQLALLLALVVIVGGGGFILQKGNRESWSGSQATTGGKLLSFPINDVARVVIKTADSEANLVRANDAWTVGERAGYPASFEQVSELLRKLWELKPVQDVPVGPSQRARMELVEPGKGGGSGTLVEMKDKDGKTLAGVLLGKKFLKKSEGLPPGMEGFPAGRYVMPSGGANVSLVSESFESVEAKPERWLNRDFFKVDTTKSIEIGGTTRDAMKWKIERVKPESNDWKLADQKPDEAVDPTKVNAFASSFASPSIADVLAPDAKPADTGLDQPAIVTIGTNDDFKYVIKVGKLQGENYPVQMTVTAELPKERKAGADEKPEDKKRLDDEFAANTKRLQEKLEKEKKFEQRVYLIAKSVVEPVMKERASLLVEKKPEPPAAAAPAGAPAAPSQLPILPGVATPPLPPTPSAPPQPSAPAPSQVPAPAPAPPAPNPAPSAPSPEPPAPSPAPTNDSPK